MTLHRPNVVIVYICESSRLFGRQSKVTRYLSRVCASVIAFSCIITLSALALVWRGDYLPTTKRILWVSVGVSAPFLGLSATSFASLHLLICLLFRIELKHFTMKVFASAVSPNTAFAWGSMLRSHMGAFSRSFGLALATISATLIMASFPLLISSLSHWRAVHDAPTADKLFKATVVSNFFLLCFLFILVFFIPPALPSMSRHQQREPPPSIQSNAAPRHRLQPATPHPPRAHSGQ